MNRIYFISRVALAAIWFYHGLVPKLIYGSPQEVRMNNTLMPFVAERPALVLTGILEILLAILLIVLYRNRWLVKFSVFFAVATTLALAFTLPDLFQNAFNPFSLNLAVLALALVNLSSNGQKT